MKMKRLKIEPIGKKKPKRSLVPRLIIMTVLAVAACTFGVYQYRDKLKYKQEAQNAYDKAFYEACAGVDDLRGLLQKASLLSRSEQLAPVYADVWRAASRAKDNLAALPYDYEPAAKTSKYLSQAGDFAYAMFTKTLNGAVLSVEDAKNAASITEYAEELADELLLEVAAARVSGGVDWDYVSKVSFAENVNSGVRLAGYIGSAAETLSDYPALIYDGPFSDHIQGIEPMMTKGQPIVSKDEAREKAEQVLSVTGLHYTEVVDIGETPEQSGSIPVYSFSAALSGGGSAYIDVTKQGGLPLFLLSNETDERAEKVEFEKARQNAEYFLSAAGFTSMKYSYYEYADGYITINYAPYIGGVIMYPDLVKVKVCVNGGAVAGFEALGYITMHRTRDLPEKELTAVSALYYIPEDAKVLTVSTAVIPSGSYTEKLCYEFRVEQNNMEFLIYINAVTGVTEDVFKLNISEYGVLAE
ncbi:germination protein YpeB [Clostridia bacterium]|nr:germination protein YpeB [Clostridia bacterium]